MDMLSHKHISKFINFCRGLPAFFFFFFWSRERQRQDEPVRQFVGCEVLTSDITANSWGLLLAESAASKLVCLKRQFTGCPVAFGEGGGGKK